MNKLKKLIKGLNVNRTIRFLTYSDIVLLSGWGLINPILAVFIKNQIIGGSIELIGLAATLYFITKSIVQIPVAKWVDSHKGERDDFWVMIAGSFLISFSAFLYIWAKYPWHVYGIQFINGLGQALSYPSWLAIFTRHIDKRKEALEWSIYYTTTDVGGALTAGLGGFLAVKMGFQYLFVLVGTLSLVGTILLAGITKALKK